jgi:hypothetical protein
MGLPQLRPLFWLFILVPMSLVTCGSEKKQSGGDVQQGGGPLDGIPADWDGNTDWDKSEWRVE